MSTTTPEGLLLGEYELAPSERAALQRRHSAALKVVRNIPPPERIHLLRAVVWPSEDFVAAVAERDANGSGNFGG